MSFTLTIGVQDLERTEEFYRNILRLGIERFVPAEGHPPVLLLCHGGTAILFRELATLEALHPVLFQNLQRHPLGVGTTLEFAVKELPSIARNILREDLHTLYEMEDDEFGHREIWLHDPDGYLVVLSQTDDEQDG